MGYERRGHGTGDEVRTLEASQWDCQWEVSHTHWSPVLGLGGAPVAVVLVVSHWEECQQEHGRQVPCREPWGPTSVESTSEVGRCGGFGSLGKLKSYRSWDMMGFSLLSGVKTTTWNYQGNCWLSV